MDTGCCLQRGRAYFISHLEDDPNRVVIDERKICLGDILTVGLNFGDNWHHVVHGEEVLPLDQPNGAGCYQDYLELLDEEPDCEERHPSNGPAKISTRIASIVMPPTQPLGVIQAPFTQIFGQARLIQLQARVAAQVPRTRH